MNQPNKVILHCSATKDKGDLIGAKQIDSWHRAKGWVAIGYHYVIRRSGVLELGRKEEDQGAHTRGMNANSLGVCLIGTSDFEFEQIITLKELYKDIKKRWSIDSYSWYCHSEFSSKTCPNIPPEIMRELLRAV